MKEASDEISNSRNEADGQKADKIILQVGASAYKTVLQKVFCGSQSAGARNSYVKNIFRRQVVKTMFKHRVCHFQDSIHVHHGAPQIPNDHMCIGNCSLIQCVKKSAADSSVHPCNSIHPQPYQRLY